MSDINSRTAFAHSVAKAAVIALCLALASPLAAQPGTGPVAPALTDAEIARIVGALPKLPEAAPSAPAGAKGAGGRWDALPVQASTGSAPMPDLAALAAKLDRPRAAGALLVFVSFSMPEASLRRLAEQAERLGAPLVLRGLERDSVRLTAERVARLIGTRKVAVQVDPRAFARYQVGQVPAVVLVGTTEAEGCAAVSCPVPAGSFAASYGDVTIDYALEHLIRTRPEFAAQARSMLARLERTP